MGLPGLLPPLTRSRRHRSMALVVVLVTLLATAGAALPVPVVEAQGEDAAGERIGLVRVSVETTGAVTSASLAADLEPMLLAMQETATVVVGSRPSEPLLVRFVGADALPTGDGWIPVGPETWVSADATEATIALDRWLALPDTDADNRLRHLVARRWLDGVSDGAMPEALVDGFARYLQQPVLAQQARLASLAQQDDLAGDLPTWAEMLAPRETAELFDEAITARHLALAAFLAERYGGGIVADLAGAFAAGADDPGTVIETATGQDAARLDASWDSFLESWFAGGWRVNAYAALDLAPAEDLFARGAYEAATERANRTLLLTTQLDDPVGSAEAERVAAQGSVGVQAEALMQDAEAALREHDYGRTLVLLDRAEDQYALLPEAHRPGSLLTTWRDLAERGVAAATQLETAHGDAADWFRIREARRDAVEAGTTFASLGDVERMEAADALREALDIRLFRLVLALGAASILLVGWLAVWGWNRAPSRVSWPTRLPVARREVAS